MTSVKGKGEGSFYNICAGAHEGEGRRPGGEAPGTAARRQGGGGKGTEARGKDTGEKGKRHWITGKKVPGCMIRAPARNDKGGRPY